MSRLLSFLGICRCGDVLSFSTLLTIEKLKAVELGVFIFHLHPDKKAHLLHYMQTLLAIFIMFWIIFYNNSKKQRLNMKTAEWIRYLKTTHGARHSLSCYCEVWNSSSPRLFTWHCLDNKVRKRTGVISWPDIYINRNLKLGINRSELLRNEHHIF